MCNVRFGSVRNNISPSHDKVKEILKIYLPHLHLLVNNLNFVLTLKSELL